MPGITARNEFLLFLEFCYCDRLLSPVTGAQIGTISFICQVLGLTGLTLYFESLAQHVRNKLESELMRDFEAKLMQQLSPQESSALLAPLSNLTMEQRVELEQSVQSLFASVKFHFNQLDNSAVVQSPEDRVDKQNLLAQAEMVKCRNLDHFFDVVFELDGKVLICANSVVLNARCEYFRIMFNMRYGFRENSKSDLALTADFPHSNVRHVRVRGIPKQYFTAIIQFLYTDNFCQTECNLAYFLRLMIYADYFMLVRLSELCQQIIKQFVRPKNVMDLFLVAHAHNAAKLERFCIHFLTVNFIEVSKSFQWKDFAKRCQSYGRTCLLEKVQKEVEREFELNFVAISIQRRLQSLAKADWPRYDFGQVALASQSKPETPSSSLKADESLQADVTEERTSSPMHSLKLTPTREGITLVTVSQANPSI